MRSLPRAPPISRPAAPLAGARARAEFGPRALGNRSILADAAVAGTQSTLNLKVKFRESFRPFAPAVLREDVADWFDLDTDSPYMLLVAEVAATQRIAPISRGRGAAGHRRAEGGSLDDSGGHARRLLGARPDGRQRDAIRAFTGCCRRSRRLTGCPVVVNTSFNVRGEPPVLTPEDAFRCFMGTDIDVLVFGKCYLRKEGQKAVAKTEHRAAFALD